MPGREIPLVSNEVYHVINRGISLQLIFSNKKTYQRAIQTILYYQNKELPLKYSRFLSLANKKRLEILEKLRHQKDFLVEIIAFCLMPNHFHLLLRQVIDGGISKFLGNLSNSYTRYFNTKYKRKGPLFEGKFKAIRIENEDQLLHVSRYIHLNPNTSYITRTLNELENYPYSSFPEYIGKSKTKFCTKEVILCNFKNISSYKKFVFDQSDYQRKLEVIKHLLLED